MQVLSRQVLAVRLRSCPCCGKDHLRSRTRHEDYIRCLQSKGLKFCVCCSQTVPQTDWQAHLLVCAPESLEKRLLEGPLTPCNLVKYPRPLAERYEYLCPFAGCAEASPSNTLVHKSKRMLVQYGVKQPFEYHVGTHVSLLLEEDKPQCPIYQCKRKFSGSIEALRHLATVHKLDVFVDAHGCSIPLQDVAERLQGMTEIEQLSTEAKKANVFARHTVSQYEAMKEQGSVGKKRKAS